METVKGEPCSETDSCHKSTLDSDPCGEESAMQNTSTVMKTEDLPCMDPLIVFCESDFESPGGNKNESAVTEEDNEVEHNTDPLTIDNKAEPVHIKQEEIVVPVNLLESEAEPNMDALIVGYKSDFDTPTDKIEPADVKEEQTVKSPASEAEVENFDFVTTNVKTEIETSFTDEDEVMDIKVEPQFSPESKPGKTDKADSETGAADEDKVMDVSESEPGMSQSRGKYGEKYNENDIKCAVNKILSCGWSVYKSSKEFNIPYSTLKARLKITPDTSQMPVVKKGRPFFLSTEAETRLVSYIIEMQEHGFGLTAKDVRTFAYQLASNENEDRCNPFSTERKRAGWDWWRCFKTRYGISLCQPENLSYSRTDAATRPKLDLFYDSLEKVLNDRGLKDKPSRIWNLNTSVFTMGTKPNDIVFPRVSKRVQTQTTAGKEETATVLLAVSALGQNVPPLFIFKSVRMTDSIQENAPPLSKVVVSENGWINSHIFIDFLKHFVQNIPLARPVLILMDSQCSHVSLEALKFREENGLIFITFPSHCTHLQPLNISIFGHLQRNWNKELGNHLKTCKYKPKRKDFFQLFRLAMEESVTPRNIVSGFSKAGIYPFNRNAVPDEALKVSTLHATSEAASTSLSGNRNLRTEFASTSGTVNQMTEPASISVCEKANKIVLPLPNLKRISRKRKHDVSSVSHSSEEASDASSGENSTNGDLMNEIERSSILGTSHSSCITRKKFRFESCLENRVISVILFQMTKPRGKYGEKYNENDIKGAVNKILSCGWSVYKSSKEFNIPYSTLKARLKATPDPSQMPVVKKGRPFVLSAEAEARLVSYIIGIQELGFGLTANDVRTFAYQLASNENEDRPNPFSTERERAGWDWWSCFKKRYGLSLHQPENMSYNTAAGATRSNLDAFYDSLEKVLDDKGLKDKPNRIWNLNESVFCMVTKPNDFVFPRDPKRIQTQTTAEKEETATVLLAISASGQYIPPLFIFEGVRMTDNIRENAPALSKVAVSENGSINSKIFVDFLIHFVDSIPPARPVLILMDSHCCYVSLDALKFRDENGLIFITIPSFCTHLLQPLDISIFGHLQRNWNKELGSYLKTCGYEPTTKDFFQLFRLPMEESLTARNIVSGFSKSGIYPLNRNAVPDEALKVLRLHETSEPASISVCENRNKIVLPLSNPIRTRRKRKQDVSSVSHFSEETNDATSRENSANGNLTGEIDRPSTSGMTHCSRIIRTKHGRTHNVADIDENTCYVCFKRYEKDVNGESWIQCLVCKHWYHEMCQGLTSYRKDFICHSCIERDFG